MFPVTQSTSIFSFKFSLLEETPTVGTIILFAARVSAWSLKWTVTMVRGWPFWKSNGCHVKADFTNVLVTMVIQMRVSK